MDLFQTLTRLTALPGVTGNEFAVADCVKELFAEYTGDVWQDPLGNVYGRMGDKDGPTLLLMAHMDEVGMMVTKIEENGMLRIRSVAGVDPRVLPGSRVLVHGKETLCGVVGAASKNRSKDAKASYIMNELVVDLGYDRNAVSERVAVGDFVSFMPEEPMKLKNERIAGKTFDDRACICVLLEAMRLLKDYKLAANIVFCASVQEENNGGGAKTGGYNIDPDLAIALDVTHAPQPGAKAFEVSEFDKPSVCRGGNIHPAMLKLITTCAKEVNAPYNEDVCFGRTGTDAWDIQVQRRGIPCGLISLPLRYMHTSVECISMDTLKNCAKILAETARSIGKNWEEIICWED